MDMLSDLLSLELGWVLVVWLVLCFLSVFLFDLLTILAVLGEVFLDDGRSLNSSKMM